MVPRSRASDTEYTGPIVELNRHVSAIKAPVFGEIGDYFHCFKSANNYLTATIQEL